MELLFIVCILCLQIVHQAVERLLVGIVIFPVAEIADVAGATNIGCPRNVGVHYGIVEHDREKGTLEVRYDF